jgi:DNA polymerase III alpha subunit (gram-positive type)
MEVVSVEIQRKADVSAIIKTYDNFAITTPQDYSGAGGHLKTIKAKAKELDDLRKSLTQPLDESKRRIMEFFKKPLDFLAAAEAKVKSVMLTYQQEQEEIRQAEELKLQEAARKEEERQRKVKEEQERQWREKEEAKRKEAERLEAEGKAAEAEKARLEADKAATKADERAEQAQDISVPVPVLKSKVEKISGISTKTIWKFKIVNVNLIPRGYMVPNEKMLGEIARATKGAVKIAGVEFYSEANMSSSKMLA